MAEANRHGGRGMADPRRGLDKKVSRGARGTCSYMVAGYPDRLRTPGTGGSLQRPSVHRPSLPHPGSPEARDEPLAPCPVHPSRSWCSVPACTPRLRGPRTVPFPTPQKSPLGGYFKP